MKMLEQDVSRIVSYHCIELAKAGYPCQLDVEVITNQQVGWYYARASMANKLFFLREQNLPVADLQFPVMKYLTVFSDESGEPLEEAVDVFNQLGGKVLVLIESYNTAALQFLEKFSFSETVFCQRKLLCDLHKIRFGRPLLPEDVKIHNFVVGRDERHYMDFYNKVLGFLNGGTTVDASFVQNIVARRSFDPAGYFLAESDGQIIGFLSVEIEPWGVAGSGFAYIYQVGVDDDWQGAGLASALLMEACDFALSMGCYRLGVGVRKSNTRAANFFMKHGFAEAYRVTGYLVDSSFG